MISFSTMIPTHYNDGKPIPLDVRDSILALADRTFRGYTLDAPSIGCYQGHKEKVARLTVACPIDKLGDARGLVKRMGLALGQKVMYFSINYDEVEII